MIDPAQAHSLSVPERDATVHLAQQSWARYAHEPLAAARKVAATPALATQLKEHLSERLPDYMVPSAIVLLPEMPLTGNGKVDRAKLPRPDFGALNAEGYVPPRGEIEVALAKLWCDVLRVDRVGRNDKFFELGGNSLLAIQVASRASRLGLKMDGRDIIEHESVAALAASLGSSAIVTAVQPEVTVAPGEVPLTPLMRQLIHANDADFLYQNILVFRAESRRRLDSGSVAVAVRSLVTHHDALRIRFQPGDEVGLFNASIEDTLGWQWFETFDYSTLDIDAQERAIEALSARWRAPTHVESIRMLRVALIERGSQLPQLLLLAIHHVVFDPFTQAILFEDLARAIQQASAGQHVSLPAKTTSFMRWSEHFAALGPAVTVNEERFWREALTPQSIGLPRKEGAPQYFNVETSLDTRQTALLQRAASERFEATFEEVLLTALTHALAKRTGGNRFAIGLTRSARDARFDGIDVSRTIGWFSAEFPVVLQISGGVDLGEASVHATRAQLRSVPSHGIGYGILRYGVEGDRLAGCIHPRIGLNYLGNSGHAHPASGLLDVVAVESNKFQPERLVDPSTYARLQITAYIQEGVLRMSWACDELMLSRAEAAAVAEECTEALRVLSGTGAIHG